ncbi:MAG: efflux RND transporter periplasmic adaptor subunit [Planctomycetales bacterium]|nr:efflux RND transporter periplasmic adaptor subunit [Planctomycetales bacterium]
MNVRRVSPPIPAEKSAVASDAQVSLESEAARVQDQWAKTLGLIEVAGEAKDQNECVVAMVGYLANQFPGSSVRCGIGTTRLRRYFDSRLGWLGPASDLFQMGCEVWEEDAATLPGRPAIPPQSSTTSTSTSIESLRLNIDDDVRLGRCVLWIDNVDLAAADRVWLRRALPALRSIMWNRRGGLMTDLVHGLAASGLTTRIYLGLATLLLVLLTIWPVSYRVRCTTVVRPKLSRIISAPFNATLLATHVQPGDTVQAGSPLISLDGRPLRLELESIQAQIGQVSKERDMAMHGGRVAEAQQAELRIRELSRQRDLLNSRLQRLSVVSPIDGVVVLGDLNRSIGAPLETGQAVLEIAPLSQMVIELEIPDYEIGYVDKGTIARVRMDAGESEPIEAAIDVIYPNAELRSDQNVFVAKIDVSNRDGSLRPGMRGDAIVYGPIRPWLWSLVRSGWEKTLWWIGY